MNQLTDLPNLGNVAVEQLVRVGIDSPEVLRRIGSVAAAQRLRAAGIDVCRSKLSALEGAIRGVRWHSLPASERATLWDAFGNG